jgi:hypothetical protein
LVDDTAPTHKPLGVFVWSLIIFQYAFSAPTHHEPIHDMQDPRFCSACHKGPFVYIQNHLSKCEESKKQAAQFMSLAQGIKRHGSPLEHEARRRPLPPSLALQVRTPHRLPLKLSKRIRCLFVLQMISLHLMILLAVKTLMGLAFSNSP